MTFECKHIVEKMDSIKTILPCLVESFNFIDETYRKSFSLVFKKISNFAQMESYEQMILDQFQKNQNPTELVDFLISNNPDLTTEVAQKKVLDVISDFQQKTEQFGNIKFRSIKHPGFPTIGLFEQHQQSNTLHISVKKINNINYLEVLHSYFKFIIAFYLDLIPEEKIMDCKLVEKKEMPITKEITNIEQDVDNAFDEFDEFPDDDDDVFFDDDDDDEMIGGGKTNSLRNPTPFFNKMSSHDEMLFPKKTNKNFNSYSTSCQTQHKRQPIMLTKSEFEKIKKEHPDSFHGWLKYGSSKDKEAYYICPRYWCLKNKTSVSHEKLEQGLYGGLNAVIDYNNVPKTFDDLPPDKHIYEFTDDRFHKDDKGNYVDFYPGLLDKSKHEQNLAMPCCFKYKDNIKKVAKEQKNRISKSAFEYEYPDGFKKEISNEDLDELIDKEEPDPSVERETVEDSPMNLKKSLQDKPVAKEPKESTNYASYKDSGYIYKQESVNDIQASFVPLQSGRLGYLPLKLQYMFNFDTTKCYTKSNEHSLKPDTKCLLRWGVEYNEKQSFVAAITKIYNHCFSKTFSLKDMKDHICKIIDIDFFVTLQNGNLVQTFQNTNTLKIPHLIMIKKYKKIKIVQDESPPRSISPDKDSNIYYSDLISKYTNSTLYEKIGKTNPHFFYNVIVAFENFIQFLKSDSEYIDYTYLWDIVCSPESKLFSKNNKGLSNGVNLIILDITNNDSTNRVEILCPSNCYSKHVHHINKKSIILIKQTNINDYTNLYYDIFEPIIAFQKVSKSNEKVFEPLFENDENVPSEVTKIIKKIQSNLFDRCDPFKMPSMPGKFVFKENISLNTLLEKIKKIQNKILAYVVSFDFKCIGVKIQTKTNKTGFIPCYPSAVKLDDDVDLVYIDNLSIWSSYQETIDFLEEIKNFDKEIPCGPTYLLEEFGKIVGIFSETNQFIQINPPIDNNISNNFTIDSSLQTKHNPIGIDKVLFTENSQALKQSYAHKLKCEQNFLNAFRLLCRDKLSSLSNIRYYTNLKFILSDEKLDYASKVKQLSIVLKSLTETHVKFVKYTDEQLLQINNVTLCKLDNSNIFCDKNVLKIPKVNLITGTNNAETYLKKISDDLIRMKTTRDFILDPKHLLFFPTESSSLNNDEMLLYDSEINTKFFESLQPMHESKFALNKTSEDITNSTTKKYQYSNESDALII